LALEGVRVFEGVLRFNVLLFVLLRILGFCGAAVAAVTVVTTAATVAIDVPPAAAAVVVTFCVFGGEEEGIRTAASQRVVVGTGCCRHTAVGRTAAEGGFVTVAVFCASVPDRYSTRPYRFA
jgi:hypothetical protein